MKNKIKIPTMTKKYELRIKYKDQTPIFIDCDGYKISGDNSLVTYCKNPTVPDKNLVSGFFCNFDYIIIKRGENL